MVVNHGGQPRPFCRPAAGSGEAALRQPMAAAAVSLLATVSLRLVGKDGS